MSVGNIRDKFRKDVNIDMTKKLKSNEGPSWPTIIIVCIVFWPVGLYLIWKKTNNDKKAALYSGNITIITGVICLATAFFGPSEDTSKGSGSINVTVIIFLILGGISLIVFGINSKKSARKYKRYKSIVINQGVTDIEYIASSISSTYEVVKKDLQKMIDKGYFDGAYINEVTGDIVLPKKEQYTAYNQSNNAVENTEMQVIMCKNCGANNSIAIGTTGECEFCGSPIGGC